MRTFYALVLAVFASSALAQGWPSKPIRWIVPFPPGGSSDVSARPVAEKLSKALGQPVVVENRPGAAGNIGAELAAKSAPDGYTLVNAGDWITAAPHLYSRLGFDPLKDFAPVTQLIRQPIVLAAHPSLGVSSTAELVALAKKNPGLGYATSGAGTQQHILAEWFARSAGIKLTHVPYKGGGQAISDFVGGQVPLASLGSTPLMPHYRAGKIKLLAQSLRARAAALPEVPTYEEAGYKGLVIEQWQGVLVPAGTPSNVVARLHAEIVKALSEPDIRGRYAAAALEPVGNTPEQLSKLIRENYDMFGRLVRELNIKID
jgi:tripartite-type tricarboxylate transporter receptor subunit TctC